MPLQDAVWSEIDMIELIDLESPKAVGVRISGKIEKADIQSVIGACEAKLSQVDRLGVYVEVTTLGGIALDALIEDLQFAWSHFKQFEKKAVVTDQQWLGKITTFSDRFFPSIQVRHFFPEQKQAAIDWLRSESLSAVCRS